MKIAIRRDTNAIDKLERITLSKKLGINNFMPQPNIIIGIVPIRIDLNNLSCNKYAIFFFKDFFPNLKILFRKYQTKAKTLPS